jgi:hypothetical protein
VTVLSFRARVTRLGAIRARSRDATTEMEMERERGPIASALQSMMRLLERHSVLTLFGTYNGVLLHEDVFALTLQSNCSTSSKGCANDDYVGTGKLIYFS